MKKNPLRPRREYSKHKTTAILSKPPKNFFVFCSIDLFFFFPGSEKTAGGGGSHSQKTRGGEEKEGGVRQRGKTTG
jgi:hypothetical protein